MLTQTQTVFQKMLTYSVPRSQIIQDLVRQMYEASANNNRQSFDLDYFESYFDETYFYDNSSIVLASDKFYSRMKFKFIMGALTIINAMQCAQNDIHIEFASHIDDNNYYESEGRVTKFYFDFKTTEKFDSGVAVLENASKPWTALYDYDMKADVRINSSQYSQKMTKLNVTFSQPILIDKEILMNIGYNENTKPGSNSYSFLRVAPVTTVNSSKSLSFLYVRLYQGSERLSNYIQDKRIVDQVGRVITDVGELEL